MRRRERGGTGRRVVEVGRGRPAIEGVFSSIRLRHPDSHSQIVTQTNKQIVTQTR
jgi:hypothetical protein